MENNRPATSSGGQSIETYTSPSKLNELSTCMDFTFSTSLRSPEGPMRGRSVKEFEEQFALLRKENFDLKLRIYFLEERMGANFTLDKEEIVKNNIELMVELESLKRELQEKHDLLCQAVKAMDLEEEEFKKTTQSKNDEILTLTQEIEELRGQFPDGKSDDMSSQKSYKSEPIFLSSQMFSLQESNNKMRNLQERIVFLENELTNEKKNSASLQMILDQADVINEKYEQIQIDSEEKDITIANLKEENQEAKKKLMKFSIQMKDMEKVVEQSKVEIENLLKLLNEKSRTIVELEEHLAELEKKRLNFMNELEKEKQKSEKIKVMNEMKVNEMEEELEKQRKRVQDLQKKLGSVHQELKDNQNLLVPKSPKNAQRFENNDFDHVSVTNSAASSGVQKEDALCNALGSISPSKSSVAFDFNGIYKILSTVDFPAKSQLWDLLHQLKDLHSRSINKNIQFKAQELKACAIIKSLMQYRKTSDKQAEEYRKKIEKLEKELEGVVSKPSNTANDQMGREIDTDYKTVVTELENKIKSLELSLKEKEIRMEFSESQNVELLNKIKEKENDIVNLATKMSDLKEKGIECVAEKSEKIYSKMFDEKNKEIEKLNEDLRKRTCDLQLVVNNELWQKNREIEKLQKKYAQLLDNKEKEMIELKQDFSNLNKCLEELKTENEQKHSENSSLKTSISELRYQWDMLVEKIGQIGLVSDENNLEIEIVISSLDEVRNMQKELEEVKNEKAKLVKKINELENFERVSVTTRQDLEETEIEALKRNLEMSEMLRSQSNQACHMLRTQLEELALFLDSLMKEKSVLGFLGLSKNRKWREVIDHSLNLSRSLDLSLTFNPEQSLMQLSNITGLLDCSNNISMDDSRRLSSTVTSEKAVWVCDSSVQETEAPAVKSLREQVAMLQKELKTKNNELSRLRRESRNGKDLKVPQPKQLRISPSKAKNLQISGRYESESEVWSEPDVNVSKARIGLFTEEHGTVTGIEELQSTDSTDESLGNIDVKRSDILNECQVTITKLNRQIKDMQGKLEEKEQLCAEMQESNEINKEEKELIKGKLEKLEEEFERAKGDMEKQLEVYKSSIANLEEGKAKLEECNKEMNNKINQLKFEREQLVTIIKDYSNMTMSSRQEVAMIEKKLTLLMIEKENLEGEYQKLSEEKLQEYEKKFVHEINAIKSQAESEKETLERNVQDLTKYYNENYVKRSDVDSQMKEIENLNLELINLKESFVNYKQIAEQGMNLEKKMKEEINSLQAKLNQVTLHYSEAQLEKAKLEHKITEMSEERNELRSRLEELFGELEAFQEETNQLKCYKSKLEVKMSELELSNADLRNKLIRTQTITADKSPRKFEDVDVAAQNVKTSQGQSPDGQVKRRSIFSIVVPHQQDADRMEATSSPDLGIESDQGRFSSLEAQNKAQRPLEQTLEITRSLNDLLEGDDQTVKENACLNKFCRDKSNELIQENNALKKKLVKTKKALEDTVSQLTLANQRKKQVEKNICKQIHKTSQVLREAKANLDSGSDIDPQRKG